MSSKILVVSDDPEKRNPVEHNYVKKIQRLQRKGKIKQGAVTSLSVKHDNWCGIYSAAPCNCDPFIYCNGVRIA